MEFLRTRGLFTAPVIAPVQKVFAAAPQPKTPPRPEAVKMSAADHEILVSEIDGLAGALAGVFDDLSGPAKARCLELSHHMTAIRSFRTATNP